MVVEASNDAAQGRRQAATPLACVPCSRWLARCPLERYIVIVELKRTSVAIDGLKCLGNFRL